MEEVHVLVKVAMLQYRNTLLQVKVMHLEFRIKYKLFP